MKLQKGGASISTNVDGNEAVMIEQYWGNE